jgi:uncharacterized protein
VSSTGKVAGLDEFVGRCGAPMAAPDPVNAAMIHHWRQAMGDANRAYWDAGFAARSRFGQVIAPPAMTQVWTMPPLGPPPAADAVAELYDQLDDLGYTSIVATNSAQAYLRPQYLGDSLTATKRIASVSAEKSTRIGTGRFVTTEIDIVDSGQHTIATQLHRVLKFRPGQGDAAGEPRPAAPVPARRPRPNVTADTEFYFRGARQGALLIQRCDVCGYLQHPPWPSCQNCNADRLQPARMSGRGELYSFTVVHAPVVEPFRPPYLVALVALDEGPRVVAGLLGVRPDEAHIGMRLQAEFARFDEELTLPVFRPSTSRDTGGAGEPDQSFRTLLPEEVGLGMELPELSVPISPTFIVVGALASRDFQPVHHDPGYAAERGMPAVFTNIMTTQGLVSRLITDWTGPEALLQKLELRLGTSNFPGDVLTLAGRVSQVRDDPGQAGSLVTVDITGENGHGIHVTGSVTLSLLEQAAR